MIFLKMVQNVAYIEVGCKTLRLSSLCSRTACSRDDRQCCVNDRVEIW